MTSDLRLWFLSDCLPCFHFFFFFFFLFTLIRMTLILGDSLPPSFHFSILFPFLLSYHCLLPTGQRERRLHCFFQWFHIHYIMIFFVFHVHYWTDLFCLILPCFTLFSFLFFFLFTTVAMYLATRVSTMPMPKRNCIIARTCASSLLKACAVCVCVCVCVCPHGHAWAHVWCTYARTHTHRHTHRHTYARAHTHTRTRTRTHTQME